MPPGSSWATPFIRKSDQIESASGAEPPHDLGVGRDSPFDGLTEVNAGRAARECGLVTSARLEPFLGIIDPLLRSGFLTATVHRASVSVLSPGRDGMHNLGLFYWRGIKVERSRDKAAQWWQRAAEAGRRLRPAPSFRGWQDPQQAHRLVMARRDEMTVVRRKLHIAKQIGMA